MLHTSQLARRGRWQHATCSSETAGNQQGCRAEKLLQAPLQTAKAKAAREPARKLMPGSRPKTDSAQAAQESCRRPRHTVKSVTGLIP